MQQNQTNEKIPSWCLEQTPIRNAVDEYGKRLYVRYMQQCINELKSVNSSMRHLVNVAVSENMSREEVIEKVRTISLSNDAVISSLMGTMNRTKDTLPENYSD
jgi:hypothetical protein